jgi:hypothetical protein
MMTVMIDPTMAPLTAATLGAVTAGDA